MDGGVGEERWSTGATPHEDQGDEEAQAKQRERSSQGDGVGTTTKRHPRCQVKEVFHIKGVITLSNCPEEMSKIWPEM